MGLVASLVGELAEAQKLVEKRNGDRVASMETKLAKMEREVRVDCAKRQGAQSGIPGTKVG